ncbi:hypothetical protein B6N60_03838 [Richelia sinica FACHB-800]|uniref:Uncharacterized protein n=1 Tax=Richelia sinica FACHB-800 TaxID=1357546 RepID=A0A975TAC3_9NOST|nr:hypothetical protein B6N60_03838 [Richelia sinica FACHB-800]
MRFACCLGGYGSERKLGACGAGGASLGSWFDLKVCLV